jgi:hypothetical protein
MVAPGEALEFFEGRAFQRAARSQEGLTEAIKEHFQKNLKASGDSLPSLAKAELEYCGKRLEYLILRKKGGKIGILTVAEIKHGVGIPEHDLEAFKKMYLEAK